ncbi:hypothetical protein AV935_03735 [Levilactobacillus brevis]|uniref:hypothetical protein n=1 Tax=Levilactobacillus brevis TaxID=1580 RepID=UPI00076191D7|nr:hypothetical protein [Levilactobacillus brevis]KWU38093.1 hypothetical protein AV935_03735 [Levilactobacillus brevis]
MKFIKEHWRGISISLSTISLLLLTPLIMAFLMQTTFRSFGGGTDDGWLGFWGGYLGSIIAIMGIYLQISSERNQSKKAAKEQVDLLTKQLNNEKENQYRQERPFFLVSKEYCPYKQERDEAARDAFDSGMSVEDAVSLMINKHIYLPESDHDINAERDIMNGIKINNVSKKDMYAVKAFMSTKSNWSDCDLDTCDKVSISKIKANSIAYISYPDNVSWISIWYITEIRESIKLYFKRNGNGFEYQECLKKIENQQKGNNKTAKYDLTDFVESQKFFF